MSGKKEGSSFTGKYDLETKTARPKSVGPHDVTRDQEDPADPGIDPGKGYANEIAEVNAAAHRGSRGAGGPVHIHRKGEDHATEPADESGGTDALLDDASTAPDAPPLSGMAKD
jgi:hypothetical protein